MTFPHRCAPATPGTPPASCHGFLTGIRSTADIDDDFLKDNPRFTGENLQCNLALLDEVEAVARNAGATPPPRRSRWHGCWRTATMR